MPQLVFRADDSFDDHPGDVARIVQACAEQGYVIRATDARLAWTAYSSARAAGWLFVPDDPEEVLFAVRSYCDEVES